jgi:hypothetical protein
MERVVIAAALVLVAALVAFLLGRRRGDAPTSDKVEVPRQLDRDDFARPSAPWLVVVFTSATCESCARAVALASPREGPSIAYEEVPWQTRRDLHDRYRVDTVPMILVARADGLIVRSFVGTPSEEDFEAAMASVGSADSP